MEQNYTLNGNMPLGFGMALAQDINAMAYFSNLPVSEQRSIINGTHSVRSKHEMAKYVNDMKRR
ncbi:MAG: hypothetical protein FWG90_09275 [Oscillospiraceae bacterium]|nr:hypothetical protein [Oscillospiraceae bacterium]